MSWVVCWWAAGVRLVRGGRSGREERVVTVMTGSLGFRGWPLTSAVDGKRMVRAVDWIGGGVWKKGNRGDVVRMEAT